ncbi:MAG: pyruvate, water dikinase regulatory protein [Thiobacillaceae bacterium]
MNTLAVFCLSDHTGITAEAVARSIVAQFPYLECRLYPLPFIDSFEKAKSAAQHIAAAPGALVFSTLTDPAIRRYFRASGVALFDVFELIGPSVEAALGQTAIPCGGHTHGIAPDYEARMDAVNFSLATDDGLATERLNQAELILVGVSRVGKTPTALYLALHYGIRAANYPLTPDDLTSVHIPPSLHAHLPRLRGLTVSAERLVQIRQVRYPDSRYASREQCEQELAAAEALFRCHHIPVIDSTRMSVEEIAARLRNAPASHPLL